MSGQPADTRREASDSKFSGVAIDRDAEVPIGVQLAWALRTRIRDGELKPGQRLPGLRDLAEVIGVNLNTVRAVYQRLEHEGMIESQQGSGTFVAPSTPREPAVGTIAATAARAARETGVDPREVAAALYVAPEPPARSSDETADFSEVGQRRLLRRQIAAFESALGEIEAANPGVAPASVAPPSAQTPLGGGPALLSAQELEQVRTLLVRRLATVQAAIDEQGDDAPLEPPATLARTSRKAKSPADARPHAKAAQDATDPPKRKRPPRPTARALPAST
jgi:DNA-binding transcriptional regulator YhcF (GntR family)